MVAWSNTPRFDAFLVALARIVPVDECVLIGSAVLAVRGIRDVEDLDVLVKPRVLDRLRVADDLKSLDVDLPDDGKGVLQLATSLSAFYAVDLALSVDEVFQRRERAAAVGYDTRGWWVMTLNQCIEIKRKLDREKDLADVEALQKFGVALVDERARASKSPPPLPPADAGYALRFDTLSLVSHCPYCGSDNWNEPGVHPITNKLCDHPTRIGGRLKLKGK